MKNTCVEPKISHLVTSIELEYDGKVWNCLSAKINTVTIEFWYISYMSCSDINDERFASQNVTPLRVKSSYCSQTNANFALKNICDEPKILHLLTSIEL